MTTVKKEYKITNPCIIRSDAKLKALVKEQISEQELIYQDLIDACEKKGITVRKEQISRYITCEEEMKGMLTQEALLCICSYLGIEVTVESHVKK